MDALKQQIREILNANSGTILYPDLYNQVTGRDVQNLPRALREMKEAGEITKGIRYLAESNTYENRITIVPA